jgi:peptidoglycan/xylan/chitin deacetylase (PgdA/CDA1 family)
MNDMTSMDSGPDVGAEVGVGYNVDVGSYVGTRVLTDVLDILYEYEFGTMVNILFCVLDS